MPGIANSGSPRTRRCTAGGRPLASVAGRGTKLTASDRQANARLSRTSYRRRRACRRRPADRSRQMVVRRSSGRAAVDGTSAKRAGGTHQGKVRNRRSRRRPEAHHIADGYRLPPSNLRRDNQESGSSAMTEQHAQSPQTQSDRPAEPPGTPVFVDVFARTLPDGSVEFTHEWRWKENGPIEGSG